MLTGESLPEKNPDDTLFGGIINTEWSGFHMAVTQVGVATVLAQIIQMVEDASRKQSTNSKIADRISGILFRSFLIIAFITSGDRFDLG